MIHKISSINKKICVFSDVHQDYRKVQHIIKKEPVDYYVCLGDWWDSHVNESQEAVFETTKLVKQLVFRPDFITLFGNHCLPYFYFNVNQFTWCSGYSFGKQKLIDGIFGNFKQSIEERFQFYLYIDDFLCTHAGLSSYHLKPNHNLSKEYMINWLDEETRKAQIDLKSGCPNWVYNAGYARGGSAPKGGLIWCDYSEFEPIEGLKTIQGHTPGKCIRPHESEGSLVPNDWQNIWVDCYLKQYLIIQNGKITVKNYADL